MNILFFIIIISCIYQFIECNLVINVTGGGNYHNTACVIPTTTSKQDIGIVTSELSTTEIGICTGDISYEGKTLLIKEIMDVCNLKGLQTSRINNAYQIAVNSNASSLLWINDAGNERKKTVGAPYYAYANVGMASIFPFVFCDYVLDENDEYLEPNYLTNFIHPLIENGTKVMVTFSADENPYKKLFDSFIYNLVMRSIGIGMSATSVLAYQYLRIVLKGKNTVRKIILIIETIALMFLGIHFIIGGFWVSEWWPLFLQFGLVPQLPGTSFATSLLAGLVFYDLRIQSKLMKIGSNNTFFKRKQKSLFLMAAFCISLDVIVAFSLNFWVKGVEVISGVITSGGGLITAVFYIYSTLKFLQTTAASTSKVQTKQTIEIQKKN